MRTNLFIVLMTVAFNFALHGLTIVISNSNNPILDGSYHESSRILGAISYVKTDVDRVVTISRFVVDQNGTELLGWMISDSDGNQYFAVNSTSSAPPALGWDVAKAGMGSNAEFELTFEANSSSFVFKNEPQTMVNIFPNPTAGLVTVDVDAAMIKVNVFNSSGRLVLSSSDKQLDFSAFKNDIYSLEIITSEKRIVKKVIKQ
jgi:hypothetical protein